MVPVIHILLGLSSCHLQAYPSGSWTLLLLAKPASQEHISLSNNLWQENVEVSPSAFWLVTRSIIPFQAFLIKTFKLSLTTFCCAHQGMPQICHTFTMRRWGIRNSLISLCLASIGSDKVQWSLSPGTLVLSAGPIGLMATHAPEFNKNIIKMRFRSQEDANQD